LTGGCSTFSHCTPLHVYTQHHVPNTAPCDSTKCLSTSLLFAVCLQVSSPKNCVARGWEARVCECGHLLLTVDHCVCAQPLRPFPLRLLQPLPLRLRISHAPTDCIHDVHECDGVGGMVTVVVLVLDAVADATIGRGEPGLSKVRLPPHMSYPCHLTCHTKQQRVTNASTMCACRVHGNGVGKTN
jgi:hypothetical protein